MNDPNLHIYRDLEQRSPEWHEARRGIVTASVAGQLVTAKTLKPASNDYSRALTAALAAERITGYTEPTFITSDMWRGILSEPLAIEKYAEHYAPVEQVGFMTREFDGFKIGYSPDGLVGDAGLVEVKAPRQKKHLQTILADAVPPEHMGQLQTGLLVRGAAWVDFISYCGGMPLYVKRVKPDPRWQEAILAAVKAAEANIAQMVELYHEAVEGLPMTERIELGDVELKL